MSGEERRDEAVQAAAQPQSLSRPPGAPPPDAPPDQRLAAIFDVHHGAVFRAAYRITGNPMDAEDVLQTVFYRLLRRQDELDLSGTAGSYLHRAAVNASLDLMRSRKRAAAVALGEVEDRLVDRGRQGPDEQSENRELALRLRRALALLSPRQAEVFTLRYFEGLGNLEIARLLGSSQTAIAVILHRARHRLQKELGSIKGEPS
jgi:RNA polymerase sigma-70 factor (ECF subfamily)